MDYAEGISMEEKEKELRSQRDELRRIRTRVAQSREELNILIRELEQRDAELTEEIEGKKNGNN